MEDGRRWAIETFGASGVHIRNRVPELVRDEHVASADAQDASGHRSRGVYGEFWRGILERFEEFGSLPSSTLVRPGSAPYRIPVVNGVGLFPWRYGRTRDGDLATTTFITSPARESMLSIKGVAVQPELVPFPRPELSSEERQLADLVEAALGDSRVESGRLVVVAISSSSIGLHDVTWGEVTLTGGGCLEWGFQESLLALSVNRPRAVKNSDDTFVSGDLPKKVFGLQATETGEPASGDASDA